VRILTFLMLISAPAVADPRIGDAAPQLVLPGLDGKAVSLPQRRVVVDFFATWCEPCHRAIAALDRLVRESNGELALIIVDVKEPREQVAAWLATHPLPPGATLVLDSDGSAAMRWGQHRFPTTFIVDAGGVIRHINRGYGPQYEQRLRGWLAPHRPPP
jgi:cytochrome c biogenesis protein CcmG/thiol:disulfide interchange protein DsbE